MNYKSVVALVKQNVNNLFYLTNDIEDLVEIKIYL